MATRTDTEQRLVEQCRLLDRSVRTFLEGDRAESLRVAVTVRVLVHETPQSPSLLGQLKDNYLDMLIGDKASAMPGLLDDAKKGNVFFFWPVPMSTAGPVKRFDIGKGGYEYISLRRWWREVPALIFGDEKLVKDDGEVGGPRIYTRRDLMLTLANKEGGAHLDPEGPPEHYRRLITDRPAAIRGAMNDSVNGAQWVVAQSGAELLDAVALTFPELFREQE